MTAPQHIEQLLPCLTPEERMRVAFLLTLTSRIQHTPNVNGAAACIGSTSIAVWMLAAARRKGLSDGEILALSPQFLLLI